MSPAQFLRLIKSLHSQVTDISFVFEGESTYVGPDTPTPDERAAYEERFQGSFSCKNNSDIYMHVYHNKYRESRVNRSLLSVVNGKLSYAEYQDPRSPFIIGAGGGLRGIHETGSPLAYYFAPPLNRFRSSEEFHFKQEPWQEIEGHRCLVAAVYPSNRRDAERVCYWFDMARGGHALKFEAFYDNKLVSTLSDIELTKFRASDSREVWIPTKATINNYSWGGKFYTVPTVRTTNFVLESSLKINSGIGDDEFDLRKRVVESNPRGVSREWFALSEANRKVKPRTDPKSVREGLDRSLAEADRQSRLLNASSSAREESAWSFLLPLSFGATGVILLAGVLIFRECVR